MSSITFANQNIRLQLNWLNQFQFAGYYVAKELGYYQDADLNVTINEFSANTDISTVIEQNKADFAIGRSSLIIDRINGKDIVALGAIFQLSPLMLLTRDDTNISTIRDLKHKRIMLTKDAKETVSILAMLFSNGIRQKDIEVIPHSFNLDDLINRKTDAMASYVSNEPIRLTEKGVGYKIFSPQNYGFYFYSDILFTSSKFIKAHPKETKEFYDATIKGWTYAFEHIAQTAEMIYKHYNTQHKTLIQLIKEGEALKRLAYHNNLPLGYLDKNQLNDMVKVYKVLGFVNKDIDLDSFVYEYNHPKELAFKLNYDDIFHIVFIAVLVLSSLGFSLLFISLRNNWLMTQSHLNKKIEDQKIKIEKQNRIIMVQSKIAAVGEMLSNIAHQWRQPLNIIALTTAKIETSMLLGTKMDAEEFLKLSQEINLQVQYLSQTIDDFKNYFNSNVENLAPFNIKDAILKVNELTRESFKSSYVKLILNTYECTLVHNESLLIQAILNLYNNARDAMKEKEIRERYFFVEVYCSNRNIVISLKDSGGGIDENVIEKIFEPYFTTKHKSSGTGLGLYITYEIITKHFNGDISVQNTEYEYMGDELRGAEFLITLPILQNS